VLTDWLRKLLWPARLAAPAPQTSRPARVRPGVEQLEGRLTPSATALTVSTNPGIAGKPVILTALVTESGIDNCQPGSGFGMVTFFDGSASLGTVSVKPGPTSTQGTAQFSTSALGLGTHSLTAQYSGDLIFISGSNLFTGPSTSNSVSEVVNPNVAADVTRLAKVTVQHFPGNEALVTVTNKTGQTLGGPLYLEITSLPKTVRLLGRHGTVHAHKPMGSLFVSDNVTLGPGGFVGFFLQFSGTASFGVRVLEGPGAV
jgi:hypothetical protein